MFTIISVVCDCSILLRGGGGGDRGWWMGCGLTVKDASNEMWGGGH